MHEGLDPCTVEGLHYWASLFEGIRVEAAGMVDLVETSWYSSVRCVNCEHKVDRYGPLCPWCL